MKKTSLHHERNITNSKPQKLGTSKYTFKANINKIRNSEKENGISRFPLL